VRLVIFFDAYFAFAAMFSIRAVEMRCRSLPSHHITPDSHYGHARHEPRCRFATLLFRERH